MTKKLLVISHAGVLDVNRAVFQELARRSKELELVMIVPSRWKGDLIRDLEFKGSIGDHAIQVVNLPVRNSGNGSLFFYSESLGPALKGWSPDVVFVDEEPWSLNALQIFREFKNSDLFFFTKQNLKKKLPPPFSWIQRWVFGQSVSAFSVASEVSEVLRWKGYQKSILDLPHSFDPVCFFRPSEIEKNKLKAALGITPGAKVVSYFGRLTSEKGLAEILSVMRGSLNNASFDSAHFLFVGNGPMESEVREALNAMPPGRATFLSALPHDEVGKTLGVSDILILPSRTVKNWKEQFGRILVEAWACGSAVVGSDSGEIPHLIRRAGGGLVFPEGKSEALSQCLQELLQNPERLAQLKERGHAYVHQHLTHRSVSEKLAGDLGIMLHEEKEFRDRSVGSPLRGDPS